MKNSVPVNILYPSWMKPRRRLLPSLQRTARSVVWLLLSSMVGLITTQAQTIRYVKPTASGTGTGTSWTDASGDLQGMINASALGSQVWVAAGTYKPGGNANTNRYVVFAMKNGVALYGGFGGTESRLSQRPAINSVTGPGGVSQPSSTTLSGDIGAVGTASDNSYHIIFNNGNGLTSTAILDGFVIAGGAGIDAGGGMYNDGSSPQLVNCSFVNNSVAAGGDPFGGVVTNYGGAVYNGNSSPQFTNCVFLNNSVTGGGNNVGGAMYNGNSSPQLTNCTFLNNSVAGGDNNYGGAISNNGNSSPQLINCYFQGNSATGGDDNFGGAISNNGSSSPQLINCAFLNNSISGRAGSTNLGGAMHNGSSSPQLTNCSFLNNSASDAGGLYNLGGGIFTSDNSYPSLTNCVAFGNGGTNTFFTQDGRLTATYSLFDNTSGVDVSGPGNRTTAISPFASTNSVALAANSPAINAGSPTSLTVASGPYTATSLPQTDLAGTPRIVACRVDMGAVEYRTTPTRLYVNATATGANNGLTWADAFTDLQSALAYACFPNLSEIWVAGGTYKPTGTPDRPGTDRTISFVMKNGVALYGGFVSTETSLSGRTTPTLATPSSTTLSGDIGAVGTTSDNSYHIIFNNGNGLTSTAILDGFVITGGNANGASLPNFGGGGIFNNASSPTLANCLLSGNSATNGGGLYNLESSPTLTNCSLQRNSATSGGAIFNGGTAGSSPVLINCSLQGNSASNGGAIYNVSNSSPGLTNCSLQGNSATNGGVMLNNGNRSSILTNCVAFGNGGINSFTGRFPIATATYSLFDNTVTNVDGSGPGNRTTTTSPFVSPTSVALTGCSPAINAGNNAANTTPTDLDGNPRIFGGPGPSAVIDMGAIEFQGTPYQATAITTQPAATSTVCAGSAVSVAVVTSGTGPLAYQWYKDGTALSSQISATLTLTNLQTTDQGSYSVVVTGACNSLTSTAFSLAFGTPPTRLYVNATATGANTGLSWSDAFTDLQSALNFVCSQNLTEIWVAGGTYKPGTDRFSSFVINRNVSLYGGFVGTETRLGQRPVFNPVTGPGGASQPNAARPSSTTLSGDLGTLGNSGDNSFQLIRYTGGVTSAAVLDGFVITGAYSANATTAQVYAFAISGYYLAGAAVGIYDNSNPTLRNCSFVNNGAFQDGGAIASAQNGSVNISNCVFQANASSLGSYAGGATYIKNAVLTNCLFVANSSRNGGAVCVPYQGSHTLTNCTFVDNSARSGGAILSRGSALLLTNCVLWNNGGSNSITGSGVTVRYSLFEPTITAYTTDPTNLTTNVSPFVSASNLSLNACAPAIDAGNNSAYSDTNAPPTDPAGNPRIVNAVIDMGAFEYQGAPFNSVAITTQPISGSSVQIGTLVTASVSATGTVSTYQWYKDSAPVSGQTSATLSLSHVQTSDAGSYAVVVVSPCNSVTSTPFSLSVQALPDLTPILYTLPATQYGTTNFTLVMDLFELNAAPAPGLITVYITKDPLLTLHFNAASGLVGGKMVQNGSWTFDRDSNEDFYILTLPQGVEARGKRSVGLTGVLTPGNTKGSLSITTSIAGVTGGELKLTNNSDVDKIDYFEK